MAGVARPAIRTLRIPPFLRLLSFDPPCCADLKPPRDHHDIHRHGIRFVGEHVLPRWPYIPGKITERVRERLCTDLTLGTGGIREQGGRELRVRMPLASIYWSATYLRLSAELPSAFASRTALYWRSRSSSTPNSLSRRTTNGYTLSTSISGLYVQIPPPYCIYSKAPPPRRPRVTLRMVGIWPTAHGMRLRATARTIVPRPPSR